MRVCRNCAVCHSLAAVCCRFVLIHPRLWSLKVVSKTGLFFPPVCLTVLYTYICPKGTWMCAYVCVYVYMCVCVCVCVYVCVFHVSNVLRVCLMLNISPFPSCTFLSFCIDREVVRILSLNRWQKLILPSGSSFTPTQTGMGDECEGFRNKRPHHWMLKSTYSSI